MLGLNKLRYVFIETIKLLVHERVFNTFNFVIINNFQTSINCIKSKQIKSPKRFKEEFKPSKLLSDPFCFHPFGDWINQTIK